MAGLSCGKEVRNLMLHSGKRPDVAIFGALRNIITDVRAVVGADPRYCAGAAVFPGHGALWGAMRKNEALLEHTIPQGDAFYALCHEAGGRMGNSAYDFLGMIIDSAGGSASDRMAREHGSCLMPPTHMFAHHRGGQRQPTPGNAQRSSPSLIISSHHGVTHTHRTPTWT